ncbi:ABC transporter permease [Sabulibacter ruber]|uniref:ABC transporter permease n=1 Tax=Sabulibacter ruber TaxID=2811901 RepID=UPI001A978F52|nr:ABC transporter permease [Sabulibacter ruber]
METTVTYLRRGLSAESLKIKNSWALWLSVLAPLSVVGMTFLVFFFRGDRILKPGADPWFHWVGNNFMATSQLLLPMFLALVTALVNGIEHNSYGWKQLYAAPVPKWTVFVNKYLLLLWLTLVSFVTFWAGLLAAGYLLGFLKPEFGFQHYQHVAHISIGAFRIFLASLFILTLQFCISFQFRNIAVSIGSGIMFVLAFLIGSSWEHIGYYPYSWPFFAANTSTSKEAHLFVPQMWYSLGCSAALLVLGTWYSSKRVRQ